MSPPQYHHDGTQSQPTNQPLPRPHRVARHNTALQYCSCNTWTHATHAPHATTHNARRPTRTRNTYTQPWHSTHTTHADPHPACPQEPKSRVCWRTSMFERAAAAHNCAQRPWASHLVIHAPAADARAASAVWSASPWMPARRRPACTWRRRTTTRRKCGHVHGLLAGVPHQRHWSRGTACQGEGAQHTVACESCARASAAPLTPRGTAAHPYRWRGAHERYAPTEQRPLWWCSAGLTQPSGRFKFWARSCQCVPAARCVQRAGAGGPCGLDQEQHAYSLARASALACAPHA